MTTAASLFLVPHLLIKPSFRCLSRKGVDRYGGIKVYAVLRDDGADYLKDNGPWEALFHVDDPGPRVPIKLGKFLDAKQALDVVRFNVQYCDWRARQDLLTIMVLHNKVVEVLNPLARDFKSVGNLRKDLAGNIQGDPRGRPPEYVYAVQEYRYHDAYVRGIEDCLSYEYVYAVLSGDKAPLRSMVFCVLCEVKVIFFLGLLTQALLGYLHEKVRSSIVLVLDGHEGKILATLARLLYRSFRVILLELQRRRQGRSSSGGQRVPAAAATGEVQQWRTAGSSSGGERRLQQWRRSAGGRWPCGARRERSPARRAGGRPPAGARLRAPLGGPPARGCEGRGNPPAGCREGRVSPPAGGCDRERGSPPAHAKRRDLIGDAMVTLRNTKGQNAKIVLHWPSDR